MSSYSKHLSRDFVFKLQRKMPKDKLPERPKPPTMLQVHADIEEANADDVVFRDEVTEFENGNKSIAMEESYLDVSPDSNDDEESAGNEEEKKRETVYKQTVKMIELHKKLQDAPHILQEQYEHLQRLEKDVSDSINELKEASESFSLKS